MPRSVRSLEDRVEHRVPEEMSRVWSLAILLAIFLLGLALRLYNLDANSLWVDEIYTVTTSRLDLQSMLRFLVVADSHPPLLYVTTKSFIGLAGSSDFAVRLPFALVGTISILLAYRVGEMLWSRTEGLVGAFLLSINAYHVEYSQEARHYALMTFLALLSLVFLLKALQDNRKGMWLGFAVATSLNLYLHYFTFFVLPAELLLAAWVIAGMWRRSARSQAEPGNRDEMDAHSGSTVPPGAPATRPAELARPLLASLTLIGILYLPWLPSMWQQLLGPVIKLQGLAVGAVPGASPTHEFVRQLLTTYAGMDGVLLLLFVGLFVLGLATSSRRQILFILAWVGVPFLATLLVQAGHHFNPKYAMYVLPIILLTVARGMVFLGRRVGSLCRRASRQCTATLTSLAALSLLFAALGVAPLADYYVEQKEDWRGVADYLHQNAAPGDVLITDGQGYLGGADATRTSRGLSYYFPASDHDVTILFPQKGLAARLHSHPARGANVWGILWHVDDLHTADHAENNVEIRQFARVTVVQLRKPDPDLEANAVSILNALLLLQPRPAGRVDLHLALAEIHSNAGRKEEATLQATLAGAAAAEYDRQIGLDPSVASRNWGWKPYWDLASTYDQLGMYREAATAYEEVLRTNPAHFQARARVGQLYRQLNEPAKVLATYQQALEIAPEDARLYFLLGEAYQGLGRIEEAALAYQQVLILEPNDEWAQTRLTMLSRPDNLEIPQSLLRSLGLRLTLLGHDGSSDTVAAGSPLNVTLWWQAVATMDRDYTLFVHLIGPDDVVWAQEDRLLLYQQRPTSDWRLGLVVSNEYQLPLPDDLPAGDYTLTVGVYHWVSGQRLPVWDEHGQRQQGDQIALYNVRVTPADSGEH